MPRVPTRFSRISSGYNGSVTSLGEAGADLSAFEAHISILSTTTSTSVNYTASGVLSASTLSATNAQVSSLASVANLSVGSANAATIYRISSVTFQTGILGHLATNSSTTTFAFAGVAGVLPAVVVVSPASSLSTAFFVASSSGSGGVGALTLNNVASIATLAPMVWRAVAFSF